MSHPGMDPLARQIESTVGSLATSGARILIATSGGPDSQALMGLLAELQGPLGLTLQAAGVNHGLRAEAASELELAGTLAQSLGVPFRILMVDVARRGNLLAAARQSRYDALRAHAAAEHCDLIAVAHTATDQAETLLMNLTRGAALRGAGGMAAKRGSLIRPLLAITRAELLTYLGRHQIPYAEDPTNADPSRTRAVLRHQVLPALQAINPETEMSLARFASLAREEDRVLEAIAREEIDKANRGPVGSLHLPPLRDLPRALLRRVVAGWLADNGLAAGGRRLSQICDGIESGRLAITVEGRPLRLDQGYLWLTAGEEREFAAKLPEEGELEIPGLGAKLRTWRGPPEPNFEQALKNRASRVAFDADRLHFELKVRPWQSGDRLRPFGMDGHIKIGDLFTNAKIPPLLRKRWPLLVCGEDVVWVVGLRRGAMAPVTDSTRNIAWVDLLGDLPGVAW